MKKVIIIGGGPSGIMTAIMAKKKNHQVLVLERNSSPLKKLLMTGNGRCNYRNESYELKNYHSENLDVVSAILTSNNIHKMIQFFEQLGLISKNKNGYYYPFSNQALTIQKLLLEEAQRRGVIIQCNSLVTDVRKEKDSFSLTCNQEVLHCDFLVLACGSKAYPKTGSDGMGYDFLKTFHHTLIKPLPALVPLITKESYLEWDGVRCDVELTLEEDGSVVAQEKGELQCTSYGISGICTFQLSHFVSRGLELGKKEIIYINFVPFLNTSISNWMEEYAYQHAYKNIRELLEGFLNSKIVTVLLKKGHFHENDFYRDFSIKQKHLFWDLLYHFPIEICDTKGFESCQICNGGVSLLEIDPTSCESRIVSNLYIVGELLDMNGNCGGYNLTTCWISGLLAGERIGDICD